MPHGLVLKRRIATKENGHEHICLQIGDELIRVWVVSAVGNSVQLQIDAPANVNIARSELLSGKDSQ